MSETWRTAKVGIMIVLALAVSYGVYRYVEEGFGKSGGYTVYALFDSAQGLVEKSRVVIAGIPVGHIQSIGLQNGKARVDIRIDEGVELHEDATVSMETVSILGEAILVIDPGSKDEPLLEDGDRIQVAHEAVGTDELMKTANDIAQNVKSVTGQLERAFGSDEAGNQMSEALSNLSESIETVNLMLQRNQENINETLDNVRRIADEGGDKLMSALENVDRTTGHVRDIIEKNKQGLDRATGEVDDTVSSIHKASDQLNRVLEDVEKVTDRTARGEGTIGRLTTSEKLIDEVEGAAEGINSLVGGISRLQTIIELRSEFNLLANTFKTYVSMRIQPREDRYYLIQVVDDPRGLTNFQQTTIRRSPAGPEEVPFQQETRITRSDSLRFSLMFAKRIRFATFRFGILESSGGLAIDFHLFDDSLEIQNEVFQFGARQFPRLRIRAAYEVVEKLWVLSGVDDVLNDTNDFFFGLMLRFNDRDLKSILPFAGGAIGGVSGGGGS